MANTDILFSFSHNTSYVELEPLYVVPSANITITFATDQENGVLLYVGTCFTMNFLFLGNINLRFFSRRISLYDYVCPFLTNNSTILNVRSRTHLKMNVIESARLSIQSFELAPPAPSLARECCPPPPLGTRGRHTPLRGGGGGTQFRRRDRHCDTLSIL